MQGLIIDFFPDMNRGKPQEYFREATREHSWLGFLGLDEEVGDTSLHDQLCKLLWRKTDFLSGLAGRKKS